MSFAIALLSAFLLLLAACWMAALARDEAHLQPLDFNFGPQASFTALLFVLDMAVSPTGAAASFSDPLRMVGTVALTSFAISTVLTRRMHKSTLAKRPSTRVKPKTGATQSTIAAWGAWLGSNCLGLICVVMVLWLKYPAWK